MDELKQVEINVVGSFRLAKTDILKLHDFTLFLQKEIEFLKLLNKKYQSKIITLETSFNDLQDRFGTLDSKPLKIKAPLVYFASKSSKKLHVSTCFFAKKISLKNKVQFSSKLTAFSEGYSICKCVA